MTARTSGAVATRQALRVRRVDEGASDRGGLVGGAGRRPPVTGAVGLARERRPGYDAADTDGSEGDGPADVGGGPSELAAAPLEAASARSAPVAVQPLDDGAPVEVASARACAALEAALGLLDEVGFDAYTPVQMRALLTRLQPSLDRLVARRDAWIGGLRRAERAAAPPGRERAGDRSTDEFLTDQLLLAPAEAKKATAVDRQLDAAPDARDAFGAGAISRDHAGVIAQALLEVPFDARPDLEAALLDLATTLHPVALRREATRRIADIDQASAERTAQLQHARRRASWRRDTDGGLLLNAKLYGVQAEVAETALQAATPARARGDDEPDDNRRADALTHLFELALRAGELPAQHGIAPQVLVTVSSEDLARGFGTATLGSGTVVPLTDAAALLTDCVLTRIVLDARGAPTEASEGSRTVPRALWKQLLVRDRTCVWDGCTVPSAWLQVAHGEVPFGAGGGLSIDTCALLCPAHHRRFDGGGWRLEVDGPTARIVADPDRPPVWSLIAAARAADRTTPSDGPRSETRAVGRPPPATPAGPARRARHQAVSGRPSGGSDPPATTGAPIADGQPRGSEPPATTGAPTPADGQLRGIDPPATTGAPTPADGQPRGSGPPATVGAPTPADGQPRGSDTPASSGPRAAAERHASRRGDLPAGADRRAPPGASSELDPEQLSLPPP